MSQPSARPVRLILGTTASPLGPVHLVTDENGILRLLAFADGEAGIPRMLRRHCGTLDPEPGDSPEDLRGHLAAYFDGDLAALSRIAWATGGTPFQQTVWSALTAIPPGTTLTYGALAARIGAPLAVRAVGHANGANPISLVVPCHRLIGADGTLTGYGGGMERKRWLLAHEGAMVPERTRPAGRLGSRVQP